MRSSEKIPFENFSSATLLQYLLEKNLVMKSEDKDMIVMLHEIEYSINNEQKKVSSCLIVKGKDQVHTAMAKTVGLPLAIATKLIFFPCVVQKKFLSKISLRRPCCNICWKKI